MKPRFEVYKAISRQIREIFAEHTPVIEPLSLDESYLDVTDNIHGIPLARDIALVIRANRPERVGPHQLKNYGAPIDEQDVQNIVENLSRHY